MLKFDHVSYRYGKRHPMAVEDVTARISPGVHLLLGENGAGKTTLMHIAAGLLTPCAGTCTLDDADISQRRPGTLREIFFLPDSLETPFATINDMAARHGVFYPGFDSSALQANLTEFGLTGDEKIKSLSLGVRHKTYVAYALALGTRVLLLDEPANGLDIGSKKTLRRMLARWADEGRILIVSTHTVTDLEALYDGVMLVSHGRLLTAMPTWEIGSRLNFISTDSPVEGALYQEPDSGLFRAIVPSDGGETAVNFNLLYSAIMSDARGPILEILNSQNDTDR